MANFMAFLSSFASYLLVFIVFLIVAFAGIKIGLFARKKKDAQISTQETAEE